MFLLCYIEVVRESDQFVEKSTLSALPTDIFHPFETVNVMFISFIVSDPQCFIEICGHCLLSTQSKQTNIMFYFIPSFDTIAAAVFINIL